MVTFLIEKVQVGFSGQQEPAAAQQEIEEVMLESYIEVKYTYIYIYICHEGFGELRMADAGWKTGAALPGGWTELTGSVFQTLPVCSSAQSLQESA